MHVVIKDPVQSVYNGHQCYMERTGLLGEEERDHSELTFQSGETKTASVKGHRDATGPEGAIIIFHRFRCFFLLV